MSLEAEDSPDVPVSAVSPPASPREMTREPVQEPQPKRARHEESRKEETWAEAVRRSLGDCWPVAQTRAFSVHTLQRNRGTDAESGGLQRRGGVSMPCS